MLARDRTGWCCPKPDASVGDGGHVPGLGHGHLEASDEGFEERRTDVSPHPPGKYSDARLSSQGLAPLHLLYRKAEVSLKAVRTGS